jgi:hypothetical protein
MVTNEAGDVAIRYYQTTGRYVQLPNHHEYVFVSKRNICLAWVKPEDVDKVLEITKTCCGGNRNKVFFPATQQQVNIWTGQGDFSPAANVA